MIQSFTGILFLLGELCVLSGKNYLNEVSEVLIYLVLLSAFRYATYQILNTKLTFYPKTAIKQEKSGKMSIPHHLQNLAAENTVLGTPYGEVTEINQ